ncbi:YdcF family protein [Anaeromassilibacillus senegalensis]|uniref:YdcF family protein n=1 Tax=Anaeromassilibacillus senegalensis TaxID=1673717 RepID=A0ABS9MEY9_9FIRM|nr:YdcF family protein [Anaeromassilibacillus senegalensis]MCG4609375.1 YdcF family protein [Anaeromassilibacillus senegalensis]
MNKLAYDNLKIIWDYMHMNMKPCQVDCIVGFGNYNDDIAIRAAELYKMGYSSKILFTGGLGRNTSDLWEVSEAERFADIAIHQGVERSDIIIENKSTNTAENIIFTKKVFEDLGMNVTKILVVHQPFMERRIYAALKVYWPDIDAIITSPQLSIEEYIKNSVQQGLDEKTVIDVIVGDFQRIDVYAKRGYQIPQIIPDAVNDAFKVMVGLGYTSQLI